MPPFLPISTQEHHQTQIEHSSFRSNQINPQTPFKNNKYNKITKTNKYSRMLHDDFRSTTDRVHDGGPLRLGGSSKVSVA